MRELYNLDLSENTIKAMYEMNPDIKDIYDNFFGEVGSDISLKYLHTKHRNEE